MQRKEWVITPKKYNSKNFYQSEDFKDNLEFEIKSVRAGEVEVGDWIITRKEMDYGGLHFGIFQVDNIEIEFCDFVIDEMIEAGGGETGPYAPEWSKYQFLFEDNGGSKGLEIIEIPYDAKFLIITEKNKEKKDN